MSILKQEQALYTRVNDADEWLVEMVELNKKQLPKLWAKVSKEEADVVKKMSRYHEAKKAKWTKLEKERREQVQESGAVVAALENDLYQTNRKTANFLDARKDTIDELKHELWMAREQLNVAKSVLKETRETNKVETQMIMDARRNAEFKRRMEELAASGSMPKNPFEMTTEKEPTHDRAIPLKRSNTNRKKDNSEAKKK